MGGNEYTFSHFHYFAIYYIFDDYVFLRLSLFSVLAPRLLESFTKNSCLCLYSQVFFPIYFCINFKFLYLTLMTLIHFWIFMQCVREMKFHSLMYTYPVSPAPFIERVSFLHFVILGTSVENQIAVAVKIYFWVIYSIPLVNASILY